MRTCFVDRLGKAQLPGLRDRSSRVASGAVMPFAPDLRTFDSGRNFAAWLGLVPKQRSTDGWLPSHRRIKWREIWGMMTREEDCRLA